MPNIKQSAIVLLLVFNFLLLIGLFSLGNVVMDDREKIGALTSVITRQDNEIKALFGLFENNDDEEVG